MKFDYDYYKSVLFSYGIFMLVCGILLLIGGISGIVKFRKYLVSVGKIKSIIKAVTIVLALCTSAVFITNSFSQLQYGINMIKEKPEDALIVQGEIEELEELRKPLPHIYKSIKGKEFEKYTPAECHAHLITISGKQYYFMIKGELKVGDYVEISYLPKSTIVLEVNIIENE